MQQVPQPPDSRTYSTEVTSFRSNLPYHRRLRSFTRSIIIQQKGLSVNDFYNESQPKNPQNSLSADPSLGHFLYDKTKVTRQMQGIIPSPPQGMGVSRLQKSKPPMYSVTLRVHYI